MIIIPEKHTLPTTSDKHTLPTRISLASRPADLIYFLFFIIHIPATLLLDLQSLYPSRLVPPFIRSLLALYVQLSGDPLIGGLGGFFGRAQQQQLVWFQTFVVLEAVFQLPVFILGIRGLYKGSRSIYVLLLVYAASTATTTLPCIVHVLHVPSASVESGPMLSSDQRLLLLASYFPFFAIPLLMALDMSVRVLRLLREGLKAEEAAKWK